jgi:hypothetical protein
MVQCFDMQRKHYSSPSACKNITFAKEGLNLKSWSAGNRDKSVSCVLNSVY